MQWNESTKQNMALQYAHLVLSKGSMQWTVLHKKTSVREAVCGGEFIFVCGFVYLAACSTDCTNLCKHCLGVSVEKWKFREVTTVSLRIRIIFVMDF